jgi:hypothetical protein
MINQMGCFLLGATGNGFTTDGNAIIGSVSDDPYDIRTFLREMRPEKSLPHIGTELVSTSEHTLSERGYFARPGETTRGLNQAGLAFTCAMIIEDETIPRDKSASNFADLTEKILKECLTIEDAISIFEIAQKVNPAYTILLADAQGGLAQLEVGNYGISVNHVYSKEKPGIVFSVNCYVSELLKKFNAPHTDLLYEENNNKVRLSRGRQLSQDFEGHINVFSVSKILSDHANNDLNPLNNPILEGWGYSICNHGTKYQDNYLYENLPWGTVSAEIIEPSKGNFWYAYGWPCGLQPEHGDQIFQEYSWGKFFPFRLTKGNGTETIIPLTTIEGSITSAGVRSLGHLAL